MRFVFMLGVAFGWGLRQLCMASEDRKGKYSSRVVVNGKGDRSAAPDRDHGAIGGERRRRRCS